MNRALGFLGLMMVGSTLATPAMASDAHFRWGIGGGMGYFLPVGLVDFHGEFRAGVQLSEKIGVYGELGTVFGLGVGGSANGEEVSLRAKALGMYHLTPLVEYDFGGPFVAGGVQLGRGGWAYAAQTVDSDGNASQVGLAAGGFLPGLDLRAGFVAGSLNSKGRRKGFSMALDVKIMRAAFTEVSQEANSSGTSQQFREGQGTIGVSPMLMFGFDAK